MNPDEQFKRDLVLDDDPLTPELLQIDLWLAFHREQRHETRSHAQRKRFLAEANMRAIDEHKEARQNLLNIAIGLLFFTPLGMLFGGFILWWMWGVW